MTITPAIMYWITRLDSITGLMVFVLFACGVSALVTALQWGTNEPIDEEQEPYKKWFKREAITAVIAVLILTFVPSSKEMAMIYVVPSIAESQVVKQDIPELYDLGVDALKDWLKNNKKEGEK
mgnify:CR=1 FL=1